MKSNDRRARLAAVVVVALFVNAQASAAESSCPEVNVPLSALLMPPPKPNSAETKAELHELLRLQNLRTLDQAQHASADHKRTLARFLDGAGIKIEHVPPSVSDFFNCAAASTEREIRDAKAAFGRPRPYRLPHSKLHVLKQTTDTDTLSYPSGHAAYGIVVGLLLADMLPEKKLEIFRRIEDYGYSRLISGVHFRSDVSAGQTAGAVIVASFFQNDAFRQQFDEAKSALRKAIGFTP